MTRTVDHAHRDALFDHVSEYVVSQGLANLSLRPLAQAVGVSPRTLLHHFESKEAIVAAVLRRVRMRQLEVFAQLRSQNLSTPAAICKAAWEYMSAPNVMPLLRLFFETYALALRDPDRFPGFLEGAVEDWLAFLSEPFVALGADASLARTSATIVLSGYRGFMLDFAATGDRERVGRAVDLWAELLHALFSAEGRSHVE